MRQMLSVFFQAEDGIRDIGVTGVQTCALPISIGRDISRTIELAISAKDDYMLAVKVSQDAQTKLGQLVQAGVFGTRAEAAAFLIDEGIKTQSALFERVDQKVAEIERLRAELRGMVVDNKP